MAECDICGAAEAGYLIQVEGAKLTVCFNCSSTGKLLRAPKNNMNSEGRAAPQRKIELEVVEGYGKNIADGRKRLGLPIEVLAEKINEKLSFLERVENEKTLPDERLCHKLEKELGIKILQESSSGSPVVTSQSKAGMTLGDILEISQKKKKSE